jgi:hypothetical protein
MQIASESRRERSDMFIYMVMTTLPWAAPTLRDRALVELERIMAELENQISNRDESSHGIDKALNSMRHYRGLEPYVQRHVFILNPETPQLVGPARKIKSFQLGERYD